jgi:hypothetical protein
MDFADARLDEAIKSRPLSAMAQREEIFLLLDEFLLSRIAERPFIPAPCSETSVVTIWRSLESVKFSCLDEQFIYMRFSLSAEAM